MTETESKTESKFVMDLQPGELLANLGDVVKIDPVTASANFLDVTYVAYEWGTDGLPTYPRRTRRFHCADAVLVVVAR